MQRLARFYIDANNTQAINLFLHYEELTALLKKHLPPSTVTIFAKPLLIEEDGKKVVEWWTTLQGQPQALSADEPGYQTANILLQKRITQIELFYNAQVKQQALPEQEAHYLAELIAIGKQENPKIFSLNGEPVIVGWAMQKHHVATPKKKVTLKTFTHKASRRTLLTLWRRRILALLLLIGFISLWCYLGAPTCLRADAPADAKVVMLFDTSGSMADPFKKGISRQSFVTEKAKQLVDDLAPNIDIGFVEFSSHADSYGTFGFWQRRNLKQKISQLVSDGGTDFPQGLKKALETFNQDTRGSIVIFSDGDGGNVCRYAEKIAKQTPDLEIFAIDLGRENEDSFCKNNNKIKILSAKDEKHFDKIADKILSPYQCKLF